MNLKEGISRKLIVVSFKTVVDNEYMQKWMWKISRFHVLIPTIESMKLNFNNITATITLQLLST